MIQRPNFKTDNSTNNSTNNQNIEQIKITKFINNRYQKKKKNNTKKQNSRMIQRSVM
jgi:hypothetical protein